MIWNKEKTTRLQSLVVDKKTDIEIAKLMGITEDAARNKRKRLGLPKNVGVTKPARILMLDIETAPIEVYSWGLRDEFHTIDQIIKDWFIICWSAKWLMEDDVISGCVTSKEAINRDDKRIVADLWEVLNEADIIVAHNGNNFDIPKINTRFIAHGFALPSPYKKIDTLKVCRANFYATSNKLDYWCKFLGIPCKMPTTFELWKGSVAGDPGALTTMSTYCANDVTILETLYLRLRPYISNHPNLGNYVDAEGDVCPCCATKITKWGALYYTKTKKYESGWCPECSAIVRKSKPLS